MSKFLVLNFIIVISLFGGWSDDPISIGSVSFEDADWDNAYNIYNSDKNISALTANNKAVILYLFEACFT